MTCINPIEFATACVAMLLAGLLIGAATLGIVLALLPREED